MADDKERLIRRIKDVVGYDIKPNRFEIVTDTTEWMDIFRGHVIKLGPKEYVVRGNMSETRFGINEQPKYWVFAAVDLETGVEKIIKTVFYEEFTAHVGIFRIRCYRSPDKEAEVLGLTKGDSRFMQGFNIPDEKNNNIRIIDFIRGRTFFQYVPSIQKNHRTYFTEDLPAILWKLNDMIDAIYLLHRSGFCHGDIRNDHIIIDSDSGEYKWIDFDLKQDVSDFDLWSLGNIISYAVAKGLKTFDMVLKGDEFSDEQKNSLIAADGSAFYQYRIMNLEKLYSYIPAKLSSILKHFTIKPIDYYSDISQFVGQYRDMIETEFPLGK